MLWCSHNNVLALRDKVAEKEKLLQQLDTQLSEGVSEHHMISVNTELSIVQQVKPLMDMPVNFYKQLYSYVDNFLHGNES